MAQSEMTERARGAAPGLILVMLTAGVAVAGSHTTQALSWPQKPIGIQGLPQSKRSVNVHPYGNDSGSRSLSLYQSGRISLDEAVRRTLAEQDLDPLVEVRSREVTSAFSLRTGTTSRSYRFFVAGVPLCNFQIRAHSLADRSTLVMGRAPVVDVHQLPRTQTWPRLEDAQSRITAALEIGSTELQTSKKCFYVNGGTLLPTWSLTVAAGDLPYRGIADGYEVMSLSRAYFDARWTSKPSAESTNDGVAADFGASLVGDKFSTKGKAKVYKFNKVTNSKLEEFDLHSLKGDGTLTSKFLQTIIPDNGWEKAKSNEHEFFFSPGDARFDEVSAFTHAQHHHDWFKKIGFEWYGPKPLDVKIHFAPNGQTNNALFVPAMGNPDTNRPSITIGDGDGEDLQNLPSDSDVVSHEYGHHVIYQTLTQTRGESLVLHEGLADYFTFARTGDSCLGESICPAGSQACELPEQCLRTASTDMKYDGTRWRRLEVATGRLGHLHGQVISGMLWDMRDAGTIPGDKLTQLTLKAVGFFAEDSGFRDFMLALFHADRELFGSKYYDAIKNAAEARGLGEFTEDLAPDSLPPLHGGTPPPPEEDDEDSDDEGTNIFGCGTIATNERTTTTAWLALLLGFPLLFAVSRQRKEQVPARLPIRRRLRDHQPPRSGR